MSAPSPRRGGIMIAGGMGYSMAELSRLSPLDTYSTGIRALDDFTGGISPGEVWTVAGPAGSSVTTLCAQVAAAVAKSARVLLANDHMPTHLLRDLIFRSVHAAAEPAESHERLRLASWVPWPTADHQPSSWVGTNQDLVVYDTLDEMLRPRSWPLEVCQGIERVRWLRECARSTNTATVLTARVLQRTGRTRADFEDAWSSHWAWPWFQDVADVSVEIWVEGNAERRATVRARGRGAIECSVRSDRVGRLILTVV